jgi:hypothetical protein
MLSKLDWIPVLFCPDARLILWIEMSSKTELNVRKFVSSISNDFGFSRCLLYFSYSCEFGLIAAADTVPVPVHTRKNIQEDCTTCTYVISDF